MTPKLRTIANTVFTGAPTEIRPAATLIIGTPQLDFLLVHRVQGDFQKHWSILGGSVDKGETPLITALRETWEEGKFKPESIVTPFIHGNIRHGKYIGTPITIFVTAIAQKPKIILNREHDNLCWPKQEKLPTPITPMLKEIFDNDGAELQRYFQDPHSLTPIAPELLQQNFYHK